MLPTVGRRVKGKLSTNFMVCLEGQSGPLRADGHREELQVSFWSEPLLAIVCRRSHPSADDDALLTASFPTAPRHCSRT